MPTAEWHTFFVPEGLFGLLDDGEVPHHSADWSNTLIAPMQPGGAFIKTGIHTGNIRLRSEFLAARPAEVDDSHEWEDIVEAAVPAPQDRLRVESLLDGPINDGTPLTGNGATSYRVRVHAHGREVAWDKTASEPTETYLLQAWPAADEPSQTLRASQRLHDEQAYRAAKRATRPPQEPPVTPEATPALRPSDR